MDNTEHTKQVQELLESRLKDLTVLAKSLGNWVDFDDKIFYNKPTAILQKPYLRNEFLIEKCKGKKVLHFGFADSPFTAERIKSGELLHLDLQKVSTELWGADIDEASIEKYSTVTRDTNTIVIDICKPLNGSNQYNKGFDVILFGEILEHLLSPGDALKNLWQLCKINNAELIITTPNAFTSVGFLAALLGNEIVHPEHYYYYSPVTLRRLILDCGFNDVDISFYSGTNTKDSPGLTFPGLIATCRV